MSGFDGDPDVQYVEINMRGGGQNVTANTRLSVFGSTRTFVAELLLLPSNVANSGDGVKTLLATTDFEAAAGIQADFEFSPGIMPSTGMVCWGAPGLFPPADPNTWDEADPNQYVDCVAYGSASGTNPPGNNPSVFPAGDCKHSLTRTVPATFTSGPPADTWAETNSATQFALAVPSPRNNAGNNGTLVGVNDADGDGALDCQETAAGSSSSDSDTDDDGCADGEDLGPNKGLGGQRSPTNFWDFFDTPTGMTLTRDKAIAGTDFFCCPPMARLPAPTSSRCSGSSEIAVPRRPKAANRTSLLAAFVRLGEEAHHGSNVGPSNSGSYPAGGDRSSRAAVDDAAGRRAGGGCWRASRLLDFRGR